MTVVADVVARIRSEFDGAGVDQASSALGGMGDSADKLSGHFDGARESAKSFSSTVGAGGQVLNDLESSVGRVGSAVKGMVADAIGVAGIGGLLAIAMRTTEELQTLGVQFNSTFGSEGASQLQSATKFANEFGVSIQSAGSAYAQFGISTKGTSQDMTKDMKAFSDAAAATGSSVDQVAGSVGNFYQLVQRLGGAGGASSRYATSLLTQHIIDQQTYNQLRQMGTQGASPQQELNTIIANMEGQYGGAGKAQANTLGGQLQTFKNQFSESASGGLSPIMGAFQGGLTNINKAMDSQGFKQGVADIQSIVSAIAHGAELLAPFAKAVLEMAGGIAKATVEFKPFTELLSVAVAAWLAWKAINIVATLTATVAGLNSEAIAQETATAATNQGTAAIESQTTALARLSTMQKVGMGAGAIGAIGSSLLGNAVGGTAGSYISTIGSMAGAGAMVGSMFSPAGTAVGAGVGAGLGLLTSIMQSSAQATAANTNAINGMIAAWDKHHPTTTTGAASFQSINQNYQAASQGIQTAYKDYLSQNGLTGLLPAHVSAKTADRLMNQVPVEANQSQTAAMDVFENAAGAQHNVNRMVNFLQSMVPGITKSGAQNALAGSGIDVSSSLKNAATPLENLINKIQDLGGAAGASAEAIANMAQSIGAQASGQYGEATIPFSALNKQLQRNGSSFDTLLTPHSTSPSFGGGGGQALDSNGNILPQNYMTGKPMTSQDLQNAPTPAYTQSVIGQIQYNQQNINTAFQLTQAYHGLTQAEWGLTQASFQLTQAQFAFGQAEFSLGRAIVSDTTAIITQASAQDTLTSALSSGYAPANSAVNALLYQATSLTQQQTVSILQEVSAYNAIENQMYAVDSAGNSLFSTYTRLQGAVQELQAQTQQYQNLLNQPLAGSKAYSAQQEQYTLQEAALQQQIAQLELQKIPTEDPRIQYLQSQLQKVQTQSQLATSVNTQGLGYQGFQIQQAQLGPEQSFNTQINAATAMGGLNAQLLAANQALAQVTPQYDQVNTDLQIQSQRNQAVMGSLQQVSSADQSLITQNNALTQAHNSVTTAANAVTVAQEGLQQANWQYAAAANSVANAVDNYAIQLQNDYATIGTNLANYLTQYSAFIQNVGATTDKGFGDSLQGMTQQIMLFSQATAAQLQNNTVLYQAYMALINLSEQSVVAGKGPLSDSFISGATSAARAAPSFDTGGVVTSTGLATVHTGEIVGQPQNWQQIYNQILAAGGDQIQAMAGAALANGIETSIGGGYGMPQSQELSGGIGPAQGLFQFEPPTWRGDGGGAYGSVAGDASWQQQVAVFVNATRGDYFGSWGPDFGFGYGAHGWPPAHGSPVANMLNGMFGAHFSGGGFVPGAGPVPIVAHGGEFVVSNQMLDSMGRGGSAGGRGMTVQVGADAFHVEINITTDGASLPQNLEEEMFGAVNGAFEQFLQKWSGA